MHQCFLQCRQIRPITNCMYLYICAHPPRPGSHINASEGLGSTFWQIMKYQLSCPRQMVHFWQGSNLWWFFLLSCCYFFQSLSSSAFISWTSVRASSLTFIKWFILKRGLHFFVWVISSPASFMSISVIQPAKKSRLRGCCIDVFSWSTIREGRPGLLSPGKQNALDVHLCLLWQEAEFVVVNVSCSFNRLRGFIFHGRTILNCLAF